METRKPNRLANYDYSQNGAYFVTICTKDKAKILWDRNFRPFVGEAISLPQYTLHLSKYGKLVYDAVKNIPHYYPGVLVDKFVVMPNHVHIILVITGNDGRMISAPTISTIIGQAKRIVSKQIGNPIWQKSFHDRIIRDESEYLDIRQYRDTNPSTWESDCFYTEE